LAPAISPLLFYAIYLTPRETIGCANRGLAALIVVLLSAILALFTTIKGAPLMRNDRDEALWWLLSTLILLLPAILLIGPLR